MVVEVSKPFIQAAIRQWIGFLVVLAPLGGCATFAVPSINEGSTPLCRSRGDRPSLVLSSVYPDPDDVGFVLGDRAQILLAEKLGSTKCFAATKFEKLMAEKRPTTIYLNAIKPIERGGFRQYWGAATIFTLGIIPYWGEVPVHVNVTAFDSTGKRVFEKTYKETFHNVVSIFMVPVGIWRLSQAHSGITPQETDFIKTIEYLSARAITDLKAGNVLD